MRIFKIILFNVIGLIVGILVGDITFTICRWLFVDLLGNFKLLVTILNWPIDYDTYAFTGIIIAVASASLYTCASICRIGKGGIHFACILLGVYEIFVYVISFIQAVVKYGFSLDVLWMIVVTLGTFGLFAFSTATE